ncbi:MAG: PEP-CTERM sorting domain-containing protein [Thermoguttaceae bacterium]|nr:PEP-CTERM sorting domain-containing protein [Thermoguttaceae bacterium]
MKISAKNVLGAFVLSLTFGLPVAFGADVTWNGNAGDGSWDTAGNWSTGTVPASGDTININSGASVTNSNAKTLTNNTLNLTGSLSTVKMQFNGTTVNINDGATLNHTTSDFHVGVSGNAATVNQYGGTVTSSAWFNIGEGATGYYNLYGGTLTTHNFYAGRYNVGHVTIDGANAALTANYFYVGFRAAVAGGSSLTLNNGSITVNRQADIGGNNYGEGSTFAPIKFDMTGGTFTVNAPTRVGVYVDNGNTGNVVNQTDMTVSGGTWNQNGNFWLEDGDVTKTNHSQTANLTISGSAEVNFKYDVIVGKGAGSTATLTLAGGKTTVLANTADGANNDIRIGNGQNNVSKLNITGGENTFNKNIYVMGKGTAELNISGGTNTFAREVIFGNGTGNKGDGTITGGTNTFNKNIYIGNGTEGSLTISNTAVTFALSGQTISVGAGNGGKGVFNISGDAADVSFTGNDIHVGNGAGSTGTINQTGGTVTFQNSNAWLNVGERGVGAYNLSGGTLDLTKIGSGNFCIGRRGSGTFTVSDSGTLKAVGVTMGWGGYVPESNFIIKGGEVTVSQWINIGNLNEHAQGSTSGTNTLTVQDTGKLTVAGVINIGNDNSGGAAAYATIGVMNLNGGTTTVNNTINVGNGAKASGTLNIAGGNNTLAAITIGPNVTTKSEMNVTGGTTTMAAMRVGNSANATGTVNLGGGNFSTTGDVMIGNAAGSHAVMNITGGTNTIHATYVALNGATDAVLNVTGGTTSTRNLNIGRGNSAGHSVGVMKISTGTFKSESSNATEGMTRVGSYQDSDTTSTGYLEISGTGTLETRYLRAGTYSPGNVVKMTGGTLRITGNGSDNSGRSWIGFGSGSATLEISGGTFYAGNRDFLVGYGNTGDAYGEMTVSGNGKFDQHGTGNFIIPAGPGNGGKGNILNLTGNGTIDTLWLSLGQFGNNNAGAKSTFNMDGGTLLVGNNMRIGIDNAATANISGGSITVNGAIQLPMSNNRDSVLNLIGSGATIKAGSSTFHPSATINVTAGDLCDADGNLIAPFSTIQNTGAASMKSNLNIDMSNYKCDGIYIGDEINAVLLTSTGLTYSPASVSVTGPWTIDTSNNQITLSLDTTQTGTAAVTSDINFANGNLGQSGWINVSGNPNEEYSLSINYAGVDDDEAFQNWVETNLLGNASGVTASAENNTLTLSGLKLGSTGVNQLFYDLSTFSPTAAFAIDANRVPEPAAWLLLLLGMVMIGISRKFRHNS